MKNKEIYEKDILRIEKEKKEIDFLKIIVWKIQKYYRRTRL